MRAPSIPLQKKKRKKDWQAILPLRREAPDAEALEEDTVGAVKEAALVDDEREGKRRCLMGAGPLLGQLHCLPSVEARRTESLIVRLTGSEDVHTRQGLLFVVLILISVYKTYHAWVLRL